MQLRASRHVLTLDGGKQLGLQVREEVFGPIAAVIRVKDYDEALTVANDTEFGLSASICTTSDKHARHFQANIQSGLTMLNLPTAGLDYHVPFGGAKYRALARESKGDMQSTFTPS